MGKLSDFSLVISQKDPIKPNEGSRLFKCNAGRGEHKRIIHSQYILFA